MMGVVTSAFARQTGLVSASCERKRGGGGGGGGTSDALLQKPPWSGEVGLTCTRDLQPASATFNLTSLENKKLATPRTTLKADLDGTIFAYDDRARLASIGSHIGPQQM